MSSWAAAVPPPIARLVARLDAGPCAGLIAIGPHDDVFFTMGDRVMHVEAAEPPATFADTSPTSVHRDGSPVLPSVTVVADCDKRASIRSLAAGTGVLYAARGGDILRFALPGGAPLAKIATHPPSLCARALAVEPTGTLLVASDCPGPVQAMGHPYEDPPGGYPFRTVRLDRNGARLAGWTCCEDERSIAVDRSGAIYLARGSYLDSVAIWSSQAKFAGNIGGRDDPGVKFPGGTRALAVDGKGHLFVLDGQDGVEVLDILGEARGALRGRFGPGTEEPPRHGVRSFAVGPSGDVYLLGTDSIIERYEMKL